MLVICLENEPKMPKIPTFYVKTFGFYQKSMFLFHDAGFLPFVVLREHEPVNRIC
jgi:hypothetical protein